MFQPAAQGCANTSGVLDSSLLSKPVGSRTSGRMQSPKSHQPTFQSESASLLSTRGIVTALNLFRGFSSVI